MLTMDSVVQVNLQIGVSEAVNSTFSVGAIVGPSSVINATERYKVFTSMEEVSEAGFTTAMPEYKAAAKYFGATLPPEKLVIVYYNAATENGENPGTALADAVSKGADFYAVYQCPRAEPNASQNISDITSIKDFLTDSYKHGVVFYGVTGEMSAITGANGILSTMKTIGSRRVYGLVCNSEVDDAAALMGVAMGYATRYQHEAFALIYKMVNKATVRNMTETDVRNIKELNGNVYVQRTNTVSCVENGASANGMRFDEQLYLDRIAYELQSSCFNLIASSEAKLLQNDTTSELFISEINRVLEEYYNGGVLATEVWRGPSLGGILNGATLEHGYAAFADSYDLQSDEDRAARKAMPITVLMTMAGAVESVQLNLYVVE